MITAICWAIAVVVAGYALRPTPPVRHPGVTIDTRDTAGRSGERFAGGGTSLRPWRPPRLRRRQPTIEPGSVAVWCEQLARAVRSGATLTVAVRGTAASNAVDAQLDPLRLALDRGVALVDAASEPSASPHLDVALAVIRACARHGGPAAEPLDRAAATLRARAADLADRAIHSEQARLSARIMTSLPIVMLALLYSTSSATRAAAHTAPGLVAVGAGASLNVVGWRWMRRVIEGRTG